MVERTEVRHAGELVEGPPRIAGFRAIWVVAVLLVVFVGALVTVVKMRQGPTTPARTDPVYTSPYIPPK